jgi:hypothetical protein
MSFSLSLLCLFYLVSPTLYMFFSFILLCNFEVGAGHESPGPRLCVGVSVLAWFLLPPHVGVGGKDGARMGCSF